MEALLTNGKKAVVLLSAGLDSAVAFRMAMEKGYQMVLALTFDYGQRASNSETRQARRIANHFGFPIKVISLPWFRDFRSGGALLSNRRELPHPNLDQLSEPEFSTNSARAVWVPNRNGIFLEVGAAFVEDLNADVLIVGFNAEEAETFPDNSVDYMEAINQAFKYSTATGVSLLSPTAELNKSEIVAAALELKFPLEMLWSCYEDGEIMCGRCESCMRLKRALSAKGQATESYFENIGLY